MKLFSEHERVIYNTKTMPKFGTVDYGDVSDKKVLRGRSFTRTVLKCPEFEENTDVLEVVREQVCAATRLRPDDIVVVNATSFSVAQSLYYKRGEVEIGKLAKFLYKLTTHCADDDRGRVRDAEIIEIMLRECPIPRIIFATVCDLIGTYVGKKGLFYKYCGDEARFISVLPEGSPRAGDIVLKPRVGDRTATELAAATGYRCVVADIRGGNDRSAPEVLGTSHDELSFTEIGEILYGIDMNMCGERSPICTLRSDGVKIEGNYKIRRTV